MKREDNANTILLGHENDAVSVRAIYSPMGLSEMHGCVLAVLDSHHRVSIWQSTGIGASEQWILVPLQTVDRGNSRSLMSQICYLRRQY